MKTPRISLEQWATFKAVVDEGSFAKAAERLNKSQSSISYAIQKMEEQLPTAILKQQGRKSVLTEEGNALYRRATLLLNEASAIEDSAELLAKGWEPEISIAVDVIVDKTPLLLALEQFSQNSPSTRIRMLETSLSGTDEALLERKVDLALVATIPTGFHGKSISQCRMIPVAHHQHAIFSGELPISNHALKQHRQVVLMDSGTRRNQSTGWLDAEQRWTVSHFSTSIDIVKSGLGFAFIPISFIREEIDSGLLRQIPLSLENDRFTYIYQVIAAQENAGPATKALATLIIQHYKSSRPLKD